MTKTVTKTVYAFHPVTGVYTGTTEADESPLEPGVFHLPACTTEQEPPKARKGCELVWDGQEWHNRRLPEPPAPVEPTPAELAAEAIARRNGLLAASDWTQLPDAPVDVLAWRQYRQALRDLTKQSGFPSAIEWPEVPV